MKLRIFLIESRCLNEALLLKPTLIVPPTNVDEDDEDQIDKLESKVYIIFLLLLTSLISWKM